MQQLIYETLYRNATPSGTVQEFATAEEARDAFIAKVMGDLFPGFQAPEPAKTKKPRAKKAASPKKEEAEPVAVVEVPVSEDAPKTKKPRAKKAASPKKEAEPVAEAPAAAAEVPLPESPKEKKKRGPMTEEAKAAMKAKREAKKAANNEVDALADGLAALTVSEPNLKKMDPTWKKHLKAVAKAQSKEVTKELENELLGYLNKMTKEEFANKKAEEHVAEFLKPQTASNAAAEPVERTPTDLEIVEFNGIDYFVNPETKRVYEGIGQRDDDTGAYENYKPVGYVGMAAFAEMKLE
jgi:hypothetical protein